MSAPARWSLGKRSTWTLAWIAAFLVQFALGRAEWHSPGPLIMAAALQCAIVMIPLISLYRGWRGLPLSQWGWGRVAWFLSQLLALAVAMHHLQSLRALSADVTPHGLHDAAHWFRVLLLTIGIPVALLSVLAAWMVARCRAAWRAPDMAAVVYGAAMLPLLCILNGALHPLDRLAPTFGIAWQSLTCFILPIALVAAALVLWAWSAPAPRHTQ
jgi:hypothetical protein